MFLQQLKNSSKYTHARARAHIYTHTHTHTRTLQTHTHTHTYTHTRTHLTHTHTCIQRIQNVTRDIKSQSHCSASENSQNSSGSAHHLLSFDIRALFFSLLLLGSVIGNSLVVHCGRRLRSSLQTVGQNVHA